MKIKITFILSALIFINSFNLYSAGNPSSIKLARIFSKTVFEANGLEYMKPLAAALNSTSNARFFSSAYVPKKVKSPYFKISLNGMVGFVRDDQKTYNPYLPHEEYDQTKVFAKFDSLGDFSYNFQTGKMNYVITGDTSELMAYIFLLYMGEALRQGDIIKSPSEAPTILGKGQPLIEFDTQKLLDSVVRVWPSIDVPFLGSVAVYSLLDSNMRKILDSTISKFPSMFHLTAGGDFSTLIAGIPQLEIGSLYGTEMLVRYIPTVNMGAKIGDFGFWGFGLKHSISQWFFDNREIDIAVQGVYQGTNLRNKVPENGAVMNAKAKIMNANLQISKRFWNKLEIYTGFAYESIKIQTDFEYYLPLEVQFQLGLREVQLIDGKPTVMPPSAEFPGDNDAQYSTLTIEDTHFKFVAGARFQAGPFAFFADYSVSNFNIFSGGVEMNINKLYNWIAKTDSEEER